MKSESMFIPEMLQIEITETMLMQNPEEIAQGLRDFHDIGIKIVLDDFGTGYSSFGYLKKFPIDAIKIDRSFIHNVLTNKESAGLVKAFIDISRTFNIKLVAEGIESKEQLNYLMDSGCQFGQGYFLCKPLPEEKFQKFLVKNYSIIE